MPAIKQVAALPYRLDANGVMEIMLITSREQRRWVIPKGNRIKGLADHEAAAQEAFEEAGLDGIPCPYPIGRYRYQKLRRSGDMRQATVEVFPFAVTAQLPEWPERDERECRWFPLSQAATAVHEPELKSMIARFQAPVWSPSPADRFIAAVRRLAAERFPIVRWFQALMPRQGRFFELFEAHAALLVSAAEALGKLLQGGPDMPRHCRDIFERERDADDVIREVLVDVRRILITPFDRTAITSLIGAMDDAIDQMNHTAKAIELYRIDSFEPQMRDMAGLIVEAARLTADAVPLLRSLGGNSAKLHELTERLVRLEDHADEVHDAGLKAAFAAHAEASPMQFFVRREVYEHLEGIANRFQDIANEIRGLVLDHS